MRFFLALKTFLRVLGSGEFADRVILLEKVDSAATSTDAPSKTAPTPASPRRSEAITLLATLQREARFVDLVSESLDQYADDQIGAAAREVLVDCGKVVDRFFALRPVVDVTEGETLEVPSDYDTGTFRLTGNVSKQPPLAGKLRHGGWIATQCELPSWTGSSAASLVVAPAEVQID